MPRRWNVRFEFGHNLLSN
uniref:Uncharacterized protein n=1 Tax=Arundo donax TaxID=35708 RepID=A0A0A9FF51_ARUDO